MADGAVMHAAKNQTMNTPNFLTNQACRSSHSKDNDCTNPQY
jgi:hypothetical protein